MNCSQIVRILAAGLAAGAFSACGAAPAGGSSAGTMPAIPAAKSLGLHTTGRASLIYASGLQRSSTNPYPDALAAFPATSTGNVVPFRFINGSYTQLYAPESAAMGAGTDIWTCNLDGAILHFAAAANGNPSPNWSIAGSNVPMHECGGMTVDAAGNVFATDIQGYNKPALLLMWKRGMNGNVAPSRVYGGSRTLLEAPAKVAEDLKGRIWVTNVVGSALLEAFGSTGGNVAPIVRIGGSSTQLTEPIGLAIDPHTQDIAVTQGYGNDVLFFAPNANGNAAPLRRIFGGNTGLEFPDAVAIDGAGYTYVANCPVRKGRQASIVVFAPGANGNATPVQVIEGSNVWFSCIEGLSVK